jgi:hypothetical protein
MSLLELKRTKARSAVVKRADEEHAETVPSREAREVAEWNGSQQEVKCRRKKRALCCLFLAGKLDVLDGATHQTGRHD